MTNQDIITKAARELRHNWIILDSLKFDENPDLDTYMHTIDKIKHVEETYTSEEIMDGNLLCDIW